MTPSTTTPPLTAWATQVLERLRVLPGGGDADAAEAAWKAFAARETPLVTIFGVYDAGKSSLLKRLLVDAGCEVPAWLTVSGRRETYEVQEVEGPACGFKDTPGISGGNTEHEAIAREALSLSDAYLVAMPPQLLTSDREAMLELLSGRFFQPAGTALGSSIVLAISRMDEAGIDPTENEYGYAELAARKRAELSEILNKAGVDATRIAIHTVAADPYQQVGNMRQPSKQMYEEFRGWDGMDALSADLEALSRKLPALREQAEQRYFARLAQEQVLAIAEEAQRKIVLLEAATNSVESFALEDAHLDALLRAAKAELEGLVEEQLLSAASHGGDKQDDILKFVEPRLMEALKRWATKHQSQLDAQIKHIEAEIKERGARQGGKRLRDYLDAEPQSSERGAGEAKKAIKKAKDIGATLRTGLRDLHEAVTGKSVKQTREELKKLEGYGTFTEYQSKVKGKGKFQSEGQADTARSTLKIHDGLTIGVPVLLELGSLALEVYDDHKRGAERAEKRERLTARLRESAKAMAADQWESWESEGVALKTWLAEQRLVSEAARKPLETEIEVLKRAQDDLQTLLEQARV